MALIQSIYKLKCKWDIGIYLKEPVGSCCGYRGRDPFNQNFWKFRSKTQWIGSVQPEKFRKTGPHFEVDHFSRSDRSEFWLNAESRPTFPGRTAGSEFWLHGSRPETLTDNRIHILPKLEYTSQAYNPHTEYRLHNETCIILRASSRLP